MELGASVISLRYQREEDQEEEQEENLVANSKSLNVKENSSLRCLLPQILASLAAAAFHIGNGTAMAYSAVLISQLEEDGSDFKATKSENAFMASIIILIAPFASIVSGVLMDKFGRLNTIKLAIVPGVLGWVALALAPNMKIIIMGRILTGIAASWGTNPAIVYITEIAHPKLRMSLMQLSPTYVSLGMIVVYLAGMYTTWRMVAWICNIFIVLPVTVVFFIPESPMWLILKGRTKEAKKSLEWLNKKQPQPEGKNETFAEIQFKVLKKQHEEEEAKSKNKGSFKEILHEFMKPTGYKPLIIMCPLFFCQHFSGIYITMFYSITFIKEAGTDLNAYFVSALIGVVRFIMASTNVVLLKYLNRRTALISSCAGMAFFMYLSGQYTLWIKEEVTTAKWVPVVSLLMYVVCSVNGLMYLPFMVISELFPVKIRGVGYTIGYSMSMVFMFAGLQGYYWLYDVLGGITHLQWFFSAVCAAGLVYSYIFMPETKGKKLSEISNNFKKGWLYIGKHHDDDNVSRRSTV
ncbi:facilitated trehalose transporter Tret1 [Diabrotica virgifera virgifera]|uniref:Facilitated trehalose transporter Tret1-like n=1 Tax=Diabrotica virgifera virgifera TaxID=50390 RepID=A0A6P7FD49_DIAVI|nr:facilitated trehalose transporter Tret1 [Diabrotica virgifera virgifera]